MRWILKRSAFRFYCGSILLLLLTPAAAQEVKDTVMVPAGSLIKLNDSLLYIPADTTLYLDRNARLFIDQQKIYESRRMLKKLSDSTQNDLLKSLYSLLISTEGGRYRRDDSRSEEAYLPFQGMKIRDIIIRRLPPFGSTIDKPMEVDSAWMNQVLNSTHFRSREFIIRNQLKIEEGDSLNAYLLADNERILRQLSFIKDARIVVIPLQGRTADLLVVTRDVYSLGGNWEISDVASGKAELYEQNFLGLGHEISFTGRYDFEKFNRPQYHARYKINNLLRSFSDLELNYINGFDTESKTLSINKSFLTPYDKWAGGAKVERTDTKEDLDTLSNPLPLRLNYQDYWIGRSFLLSEQNRSRFILYGRYRQNKIFERPEIEEDSFYQLQSFKLFLFSLAFSRQNYYTTNLMYDFGKREDLPYGSLHGITLGYEKNEFNKRAFFQGYSSYGIRFPSAGYFRGSAGVSGFIRQGKMEQGLLSAGLSWISPLVENNNHFFRSFVNLSYDRGINRFRDEKLLLNKPHALRGFASDSVRGSERLVLSMENVLFSPLYIYGFRFVFYGFADLGWIQNQGSLLKNPDWYSSLGLGVRIRNDNLVLKTLQIRFAVFPRIPPSRNLEYFNIQPINNRSPLHYNVSPPEIPDYH